jgi:dinuclear metal center YbgI/SA1388 family protein
MKLESLLQYMNGYLGIEGHPDYPNALNGLQVSGPEDVSLVASAVDASQASIEAAIELGADLLMVHHGLFWDGLQPITGRAHRRLSALMGANMALYSCHLPLDTHSEIGNCVLLGRAMGLELEGRIGQFQGVDLGWWGRTLEPTSAEALVSAVSKAVGGDVHLIPGGPERVERVGVLTGGGGSFARAAADLGLDALVTGEGSHHTHFDAMEFGIHVLFAGHYATETFGVRALGEHVAERFDLDCRFLDQPTGL